MPQPMLEIDNVSHWFGHHHVLHNLQCEVERGQIVAMVGPSGCGKSTLLRAIVGTHPPKKGNIVMHDRAKPRVITSPGRDRGMVYQRYSLFPHLTAQENVAYGLMVDETDSSFRTMKRGPWKALRKKHLQQAAEMLEKMQLQAALKRYPPEMSGGMCQRVAIAQALIMKPSILLLDEPFGALDEATREELQRVLLSLDMENRQATRDGTPSPHTILIVTHEINEAIFVSDRVIGLSQYWGWQAAGHEICPGAAFVYDKPSPIFAPDDPRDFLSFQDQKEEILHAVFNPSVLQSRNEYIEQIKDRAADRSRT